MSKQTSLFLTQDIVNTGQVFVSGENLLEKVVARGGANDSLVKSMTAYSNNPNIIHMTFYINTPTGNGTQNFSFPFITVPVPANAGSGVFPAVDVFSTTGLPTLPTDSAGKRYYPLGSGCEIRAVFTPTGSMTPSGRVFITSILENY